MEKYVEQFTGRAEAYARYRQRYPTEEVLGRLRAWCGLERAWVVADVGAGTGMLAEVFLENGNPVMAVEPNAEMRAACEGLRGRWPRLTVVDGTAENTGLAEGSVEMVAAGRAFHWFDTERALREFRRVLVPGGWVALVSSRRAEAITAQAKVFESLLAGFRTAPDETGDRYRVHERLDELFTDLHQEEIGGEVRLRWEELQGFAQSLSMVPQAEDPRARRFAEELRRFFGAWAVDGVLRVETTFRVAAGRIRG